MKFEDLENARQKYETGVKELSEKRRKIIFITSAIVFSIEIGIICLSNPLKDAFKNDGFSMPLIILTGLLVMFASVFQIFIIAVIVNVSTTNKSNFDNVANFHQAYKRAYKSFFIQKQLSNFFSDIKYDHDKGLDKKLLDETDLIYTGDIYKSNDLVKAKYKDIGFLQADVEIINERKDDDDVKRITVFKGRYLIFEFPKKFNFKMIISHDGYCGSYINPKTKRGLNIINTESPEFNKRFLVYAEDSFEAFYILSPDFLEEMEKLGNRYNNRLSFYFSDNKFYVGLNDFGDSFEPPDPSVSLNEKVETAKVAKDMKLITDLVDNLKLNR